MVSQTIEDLFSKLAPIIGEQKTNSLWLLYQTETDLEKRREFEGIIHSLASKHLNESYQNNKILLPPPQAYNNAGYYLGKVYYGDEPRSDFYLPEHQLLLHCAVFGVTGAGKTNFGFLLVKQLLQRDLPFTIFDWKRNYRDILATHWARDKEILVYTVGRDVVPFSFNPLFPPPGTDQQVWDAKLIDILCHSHFLGHGVRYWLKMLLNATGQHSLEALLNAIRQTKAVGRPRQWLDSALRAVGDLCIGYAGKVFNSNPGVKLDELLTKNVIFELDALPEDAKKFFTEIILAWIHQYRMNQTVREVGQHAMLIEEAHHILFRERAYQEHETIMDIIFREIRELGEALIVFDQHPSEISKPALGNTGTTLIMRLKHAEDVRAAADSILLDYKQRDYIGQLQTGCAIVKAPEVSGPFMIRIPYMEIQKGLMTDDMLREKFTGYSGKCNVIPPSQHLSREIPLIPQEDKEEKNEREKLTEIELAFLMDIIDHPTSGVVERYNRLGLSMQRGTNLKRYLEEKQLIAQHKISTGAGAIRYLELTRAGYDALKYQTKVDYQPTFSNRHGGPEHQFWIHKLAAQLEENGFQVEKEYPIGGGKTLDLLAKRDGKRIAIEVETGKSDALANIDKDVKEKFDKVIVLTTSEKGRRKLIQQLSDPTASFTPVQSAHRTNKL